MGKFFDDWKRKGQIAVETTKKVGGDVGQKASRFAHKQVNRPEKWRRGRIQSAREKPIGENFQDLDDEDFLDDKTLDDPYIENIQVAQKPESFHHFILENQYRDLEKSIRGYKDVFHKEKNTWEVKRKKEHCFTDEEAEEILRTAQSHLATDIKLTFYAKDTFGIRFLAVYEKLEFLFKRIMEYRYGRYGEAKKQGEMKEQALKIFVELVTRVEANYLRAIQGMENKMTHQSVQSQESLQGGRNELGMNKGYT